MAKSLTNYSDDVFLSFRCEDTWKNFTGHLYNALRRRGVSVFIDNQILRAEDEIPHFVLRAIKVSRIFVIVLSENYASSSGCLDELLMILHCMVKNRQYVLPIFYKVDPSEVRHQRNSYGRAMAAHETRLGKSSERMINWRSTLTQVADLYGYHFEIGNEYELIEKITTNISTKLPRQVLYVGSNIVGLESRVEEAVSLLDIFSDRTVFMLGIVGLGGIGKTTLARALYNLIVDQFEYAIFLCDLREASNKHEGLVRLQERLLSELFDVEDIKVRSVEEGVFEIKNRLCKRKVLLVVDDVDKMEQLKKLAGGCHWFGYGSRIIVTTRDRQLLNAHGIETTYEMELLNDHDAFELFCREAFKHSCPPKEFVKMSDKVVKYARGLPLALKVIGSSFCGKTLEECESALERYQRIPDRHIHNILRISYDDLEDNQKGIFLDIACSSKGGV